MISNQLRVGLYSILVSILLYGTHVACSSSSKTVGGPESPAQAQATPAATPPCTQWEVKDFLPSKTVDKKGGDVSITTFEAFSLPEGFEPFATVGCDVIGRHCISQ